MPDFTLLGLGGRNEEGGSTAADSGGTAIATTTADTKGSYVELIASTKFNSSLLVVNIKDNSVSPIDHLVDIAVGAAASEQDVISNILISARNDVRCYMFPIFIAAGSRISARAQSDTNTEILDITVRLFGKTLANSTPLGRCTTYGADTGDTSGVGIDPGATGNTKGSYAEITAATTNNIREALIVFGGQSNNAMTDAQLLVDFAVGAAASEQDILDNILVSMIATGDIIAPPIYGPVPLNIPSGTRLSARAQSSITDATDRLFDVVVYGLD